MTRRSQYLAGITVFAPLWFMASFALMLRLIAAEDPGWDNEQTVKLVDGHSLYSIGPNDKGEPPPTPLWLKVAYGIACPLFYILPDDGFHGLSDHANGTLYLLVMVANSIMWGFILVFLFRFTARFFSRKKCEVVHAV